MLLFIFRKFRPDFQNILKFFYLNHHIFIIFLKVKNTFPGRSVCYFSFPLNLNNLTLFEIHENPLEIKRSFCSVQNLCTFHKYETSENICGKVFDLKYYISRKMFLKKVFR